MKEQSWHSRHFADGNINIIIKPVCADWFAKREGESSSLSGLKASNSIELQYDSLRFKCLSFTRRPQFSNDNITSTCFVIHYFKTCSLTLLLKTNNMKHLVSKCIS